MSTRVSGKKRRRHDLYETPTWLIADALALHIDLRALQIHEPACGNAKMTAALEAEGAQVTPTDIKRHPRFPDRTVDLTPFVKLDFVASELPALSFMSYFDALVFNPPYGVGGRLGVQFIERGLQYLRCTPAPKDESERSRWMAVLLPVDFDSAVTRTHLFEQCPEFAGTIVLRQRIEWFRRKKGANGPSANHAWYLWKTVRPGTRALREIRYAPRCDRVTVESGETLEQAQAREIEPDLFNPPSGRPDLSMEGLA